MAFNDIFTVLKGEKYSPTPSDEELEKIPSFMFCRYLGGNPSTIFAANQFNMYHKEIPMPLQYKMVKQVFGGKKLYSQLPKKSKTSEDLDCLCKHFKISRDKAKEYRTFLSDAEFEDINISYKNI